MVEEIDQSVQQKYEILLRIGKGAYGTVWKATDKKSGETVALKKIYNAFQNSTDAQRIFREIMFLQELSNHENIIKLLNVIYLVFEYQESDLYHVIRANIRTHSQKIHNLSNFKSCQVSS